MQRNQSLTDLSAGTQAPFVLTIVGCSLNKEKI